MLKPRSATIYARIFIGMSIFIFIVFNLSFYLQGERIRTEIRDQISLSADNEIIQNIALTQSHLHALVEELQQWDEIKQQLMDGSYYYYWRDQHLKQTPYFQPYYDQIELYRPNGQRVSPLQTRQYKQTDFLPATITPEQPESLLLDNNNQVHYRLFAPINSLDSPPQLIGYVGVSVQLIPAMLDHGQFFFTQKASLGFDNRVFDQQDDMPASRLISGLTYSAVNNPVNEYMWQLIESFIVQTALILALFAWLFFWLFSRFMQKPLLSMIEYVHLITSDPEHVHPPKPNEFLIRDFFHIKQAIYQFFEELSHAQAQLNAQNLQLFQQTRQDSLTGVANRRAFEEAWHSVIQRAPTECAFVLFDCDFFKALNDTHGHEIGDQIIRISAQTIDEHLPPNIALYRIGGDEFCIIIEDQAPHLVKEMISDCLAALKAYPFAQLGVREDVTFSVGISSSTPDIDTQLPELPKQADVAMYRAKQSHHDKIQFYNHDMAHDMESALLRSDLLHHVLNSIYTGQDLKMHFQPIIDVHTGAVYYESLIRMQQADALIYPNDIFAVVNRRRLETTLDQQVLNTIIDLFEHHHIPPHTGISINISGKTLLQTDVLALLTPLIPFTRQYKVVIEVTETSLIEHFDYVGKQLSQLRSHGFFIALDDFGSGYSSIRYLANMPVDIIKFDMSLLRALENGDSKTQTIITSTAQMILSAGYQLVVEGVETEQQLHLVTSLGATHVQGYLLGKPNAEFLAASWPTKQNST
jgi:diguanylate cyclase (GGDEF)-like protein